MTVGEALAEARAAAGLSVAEVSERTSIREMVIRGIERDDFFGLGGDLYVRGYLRAIAAAVGVDPQPLIHDFDASRTGYPASPVGTVPSPASAAGPPGGGAEQATAPVAGEEYGSFWADDAVTDADPVDPVDPVAETQMMPAVTDSWWPEESELPGASVPSGQPALPEEPGPPQEPGLPQEPGPSEEPAPAVGVVWTAEPEPGWEAEPQPGWEEAEPPTTVEPGWSLEPPTQEEPWPAELLSLMEPPSPAQPPRAGTEWTMQIEPAAHPAWADAEAPRPRAAHPYPPAAAPGPGQAGPPRKRRLRVAAITVLAVAVLAIAGVASGQIISRLGSTGTATGASARVGRSGQATGTLPTASQSVPAGGSPAASSAASSPTSTAVTPTPPASPQPVQQLAVRAAQAFGPDGVADGDNPDRASYAITPNAPRPWRTDWYTTAKFGNLQQGTGLLLDMGHSVTVTSVTVQLGSTRGANLQVLAGDIPVLSELPVVASATDVGGQWTLHLKAPTPARYVVIWFTLLPPDGTGTYRASIYGVTVAGRP